MLKRTLTILLLFCGLAFSQSIDSLLTIIESHQNDEEWLKLLSGEKNYHIVYFQAEYETNSYFAGRDIGLDCANVIAQTAYSYKNISMGAAAIFYENLHPTLQTAAVSIDYQLPLNLPININVGYDRYFVFGETDTIASKYPNSINVSLAYQTHFWKAELPISLIVGSDGILPQIAPSIYGKFELYKWKKTNSISIKPEINFHLATEETALSITPGHRPRPNLGKPNALAQENSGNGQGQGPGQGSRPEAQYLKTFGLMNTQINLELIAELKDFEIGLSYQYNRPKSMDPQINYSATSLLAISMGYVFTFTSK